MRRCSQPASRYYVRMLFANNDTIATLTRAIRTIPEMTMITSNA
jgi:hypothetical protein